jgi:hypothetical protein
MSYHPYDLLFVATLLYAGMCLQKVLVIPSKGKDTERQRECLSDEMSFSPLRDKGKKISTHELRGFFLTLASGSWADRIDGVSKLANPKSSIRMRNLTTARKLAFAQWRAFDRPSTAPVESEKINALRQMQSLMQDNAPKMWQLWGLNKTSATSNKTSAASDAVNANNVLPTVNSTANSSTIGAAEA